MPLDNPPSCPRCGRPMAIRVARQGPYAGKQFYGCTGFPTCKAIIDLDEVQAPVATPASYEEIRKNNQHQISVPRVDRKKRVELCQVVECRPNGKKLQTALFQNIHSLPEIVTEVNRKRSELNSEHLNAFEQWRLDFPLPNSSVRINREVNQVITVIEKILRRGSISFCSPRVEEEIKNQFNFKNDEIDKWIENFQNVDEHPRSILFQSQFDSVKEEEFYSNVFSSGIDSRIVYPWVLSQVPVSNLVESAIDPNSKQRVDFLICIPSRGKYVIEIDGPQHESQLNADQMRDQLIGSAGYQVIRIKTDKIKSWDLKIDPEFVKFLSILNNTTIDLKKSPKLEAMLFLKAASQLQISLLEAIKTGHLQVSEKMTWKIKVIPPSWVVSDKIWDKIIQSAINDFIELFLNIYSIQNAKKITIDFLIINLSDIRKNSDITFCYDWSKYSDIAKQPSFNISDIYLPFHLADSLIPASSLKITKPSKQNAEFLLYFIFRKHGFLEGQWEAIDRTLQGKDSILLLPTGGGKTIAFQLASFLLPGLCLVVDPLISLIDDQIDNLRSYGIDRAIGIMGLLTFDERRLALDQFSRGQYLFCYVAPERFQMKEFRSALRGITVQSPICLIAIDEAHCVSEWGHDFRVSYLNIARNAREYCKKDGIVPPLLGLTGTASRSVLRDIRSELQIIEFNSLITPSSFDRKELKFTILQCSSGEKNERLLGLLSSFPQKFRTSNSVFFSPKGEDSNTGLVFYPHVNGEYGVLRGYEIIREKINSAIGIYCGSAPKDLPVNNWDELKSYYAEKFKNNELTILTCTNAFGMGIDKPNIRFTVHLNLPPSIEAFYQEAGRAGRDRNDSECCLIVSNDFPMRSQRLLNPTTPLEDIAEEIKNIKYQEEDDITRAMYFHVNAFLGAAEEFRNICNLMEEIGNIDNERTIRLLYDDETRVIREKSVHRLVIIGVIKDYTIDYASREIEVFVSGEKSEENLQSYFRYLSNYDRKLAEQAERLASQKINISHKEFVLYLAERLIKDFIYNILELSRRRSLSEMLQACTTDPTDNGLRARILSYLQLGHYSEFLESARENPDNIDKILDKLFIDIDSPMEAEELRGQSARILEAYPNNPALLLIRSFSEVFSLDCNRYIVIENFKAFLSFSISPTGWGISKEMVTKIAIDFINHLSESNEELSQELTLPIMEQFSNDPVVARQIIRNTNGNVPLYAMNMLLCGMGPKIDSILK